MLRNFFLSLLLVCLGAWCAFTVGCGSSSHSNNTSCTGLYNVAGDWQGSLSSDGSSDDLWGVIDSSGDATFFDSAADIAVLPSITGACSFSGNATAYASIESGDPTTSTGTAQGNVTSDSAITGSVSANGTSSSFTLSSYAPQTTLSAVSGSVLAAVEGQTEDALTLNLGGTSSSITFSGTDADCSINGTFTEESSTNVYDVTYNIGGGSCSASSFTGTGFESSSDLLGIDDDASGTYLYAILTSASAPFVVEIEPPGDSSDHRRSGRQSLNSKSGASFHKIFRMASHLSR